MAHVRVELSVLWSWLSLFIGPIGQFGLNTGWKWGVLAVSFICVHLLISSVLSLLLLLLFFFCCGAATQRGSWPPHSWGFLDHTQWRTTVSRTSLEECSARRRDLYLTTHDTHNRQTSMPPVGFEPTISAGERPQTYALDCAATGTGLCSHWLVIYLRRNHVLFCLVVFWS